MYPKQGDEQEIFGDDHSEDEITFGDTPKACSPSSEAFSGIEVIPFEVIPFEVIPFEVIPFEVIPFKHWSEALYAVSERPE